MNAFRLKRVERLLAALERLLAAEERQMASLMAELALNKEAEAAARQSYDRCGLLTDVAATGLTRLLQRLWSERGRIESSLAAARQRHMRHELTRQRLAARQRLLHEAVARKALEQDLGEQVGSRLMPAQG